MKSERIIHASYTSHIDNRVPFIRMSGKWLEKAGFGIGTKIRVNVENGKLTLSKESYEAKHSIDDIAYNHNRIGIEKIIKDSLLKKESQYKNDYRGYTVKLKLERDNYFEPAKLSNSKDVYNFLRPLQDESREVMLSIMLNTKNKVVGVYEAAKGSIAAASVCPAEIFKSALTANSRAIVLSHNHPSGDSTPSLEDIALTAKLGKASELLDIKILDHVVIGYNNYSSMRDLGHIK